MPKGVLQNVITARHSEPARTLAWESVLYPRGNGLPQPLRGFIPREGTRRAAVGARYFAMTREGHFLARPFCYSSEKSVSIAA